MNNPEYAALEEDVAHTSIKQRFLSNTEAARYMGISPVLTGPFATQENLRETAPYMFQELILELIIVSTPPT